MTEKYQYIIISIIVFFVSTQQTTNASMIKIAQSSVGQFIVIVDHQFHQDYGLKYPLTFKFDISQEYDSILVWKKAHLYEQWDIIATRYDTSFYNAVEAVRFDEDSNIAFVSVTFYEYADSLFLSILDQNNIPVSANYLGMSEYYDNRKAVVTATIDDVAYWFNPHFVNGAKQFQKRKIWVNLGIISDACDENNTWNDVQNLLDDGYTEASAHSQTHPYIPYGENLEYEVSGCLASIKSNLDLPALYKSGEREYVYTWLCPYGQHDNHIDSLLGAEKILVNRLYEPPYFYSFADWDSTFGLFNPLFVSREMGTTDWVSYAIAILDTLNAQFDDAYALNGIYHLVMHPQTVDWNGDYAQQHLEYISMHNDVWYTSLGHLYLYRLMYLNQPEVVVSIDEDLVVSNKPYNYQLFQNYPNPFNPNTTIQFSLQKESLLSIKIFNVLGREIKTLAKQAYAPGTYTVQWNGKDESNIDVSSGIYFYQLKVGDFISTQKCLLMR